MASYEGSFRRKLREWREKKPTRSQEAQDQKKKSLQSDILVIGDYIRDEKRDATKYDEAAKWVGVGPHLITPEARELALRLRDEEEVHASLWRELKVKLERDLKGI